MSDDEGDYGEAYDEDYDADLAEDGQAELDAAEDEEDKEDKEDKEKDGKEDGAEPEVEDEEEDKEDEAEIADEAQAEAEAEAEAEAAEGDAAEESEEPSLSKPNAATRVRADPLLRVSNAHRKIIIVPDEERITSNVLKEPEAARAIGIRAKQIETFPNMFTEVDGETDSVALAKKELYARRCPLKLRRVVGRGPAGEVYVEEWAINTMTLPTLD